MKEKEEYQVYDEGTASALFSLIAEIEVLTLRIERIEKALNISSDFDDKSLEKEVI